VRAGGVLTDEYGRVDRARTGALRAALAEEDAGAASRAAWDAYSARWRALAQAHTRGVDTPLRWADVPWPTRAATMRWMREAEAARVEKDEGIVLPLPQAGAARVKAGQPPPPLSTSADEVTPDAIADFLFDARSLGLATSASTSEDEKASVAASKAAHHRVRREMLHWHSDKFEPSVLARVPEENGERERVAEDAGRVWRWLNAQGGRAKAGE
jgi:hypothetical protein